MTWLYSRTGIALLGAVLVGIAGWFLTGKLREAEQERQQEKAAREAETKTLKDQAEDLARRLEEMQKKNDEFHRVVEGLPQGGIPPAGGKNTLEATQALAKAKTDSFLTRAEEVRKLVTKLEKEAQAWPTRLKELLHGEAGKRLSANKDLVAQVATMLEKERFSPDAAGALIKQLATLQAPVDAASKGENKFYYPADSLFQGLEAIAKNAEPRLKDFERDRALLDTLAVESEKVEPGMKTLHQAIQELAAEQERQRLELVATAKQKALDEAAKKLAAAEEKRVEEITKLKLKQVEELTIAEKEQMDIVLKKLKADRERKLLEARFDAALPDIKRYLGPFIANGYGQPKGPIMERTAQSEPVSYTRLKGAGAFEDGRKGLERLAFLGSAPSNDRYKGNFPRHIGGEGSWAKLDIPFVQRAQDLLKEFGPIMVEKGLLSP
jgi:hypothetical protein